MIKKLRRKLVVITMVLLSAMLALILGIFYQSTRIALEESSLATLRTAGEQYGTMGQSPGGGEQDRQQNAPCFVLAEDRRGYFIAIGSSYYELEDEDALRQLFADARQTGQASGVLKGYSLRFLKLEGGPGERYAFTDISAEQSTLTWMLTLCVIIGVAGLLCFFGISLLIARWAVRPVERAWDQQRQFVADASHELKTPLTVILTNAELLRSEEYTPEEKNRFSESIFTMSRQMRGLVEELLDQARVDNGAAKAAMEKLDLSRLVADAVLPFEPMYFEEGRELRSAVEPGLTVTGNADRLRQVVDILLDNGCKYSTPGTAVELRLTRYGRGHCLLSVLSRGVTMSEQECRDIFKRFYRGDKARSMNHSYGLGLSIAQTIVKEHNGKIWARSCDGDNTFFVSLPSS